MTAHIYDDKFFDWVEQGAARSARAILPLIKTHANPQSIVDVGCGSGMWLNIWNELGVADVAGIDGDYVNQERLRIAKSQFHVRDLARDLRGAFALGRRFDLAQCLEVAEHLPRESGEGLVAQLCRLSDVVMFSAGQPGQGGEWHINERPVEYWRGLFKARGYKAYDFVRPIVSEDARVEPWYRYNTVVYANDAGAARLSDLARAAKGKAGVALRDYRDWKWLMRCVVLRPLPVRAVTALSKLNYRTRNRLRAGAGA